MPDYRLYPEVHYEGFLTDGARAVRWAKDHAHEYGGDPSKLFLIGHSAGAYIAAMLALDHEWLGKEGLSPERDLKVSSASPAPMTFSLSTTRKSPTFSAWQRRKRFLSL